MSREISLQLEDTVLLTAALEPEEAQNEPDG